MEFVQYVMGYLCDPEEDVRVVASSIASRLEPRFMLSNFKENMSVVADAILYNYGDTDVMAEGRCFFSMLIDDQHCKENARNALPNKQ